MEAGLSEGVPQLLQMRWSRFGGLAQPGRAPSSSRVLLGVTRPHTEGTCSAAGKERCCGPTDDFRVWGDLQALSHPKGFAICGPTIPTWGPHYPWSQNQRAHQIIFKLLLDKHTNC